MSNSSTPLVRELVQQMEWADAAVWQTGAELPDLTALHAWMRP